MKNILKFGILSAAFAFGFILISADTVSAQYRRGGGAAQREYRDDIRDAREDYNRRMRNGDRRKAVREYREDMRDARREYIRNVQRDRYGWFWYQNGRRYHRPYSAWNYRNGYFYRRY
ncbi:MAG TPA: hypothetical protein PLK77_08590 [Pyrinomonadaceae bacterium]|nr:hypothetical protein [Pyrinomonadaceae bacterium]